MFHCRILLYRWFQESVEVASARAGTGLARKRQASTAERRCDGDAKQSPLVSSTAHTGLLYNAVCTQATERCGGHMHRMSLILEISQTLKSQSTQNTNQNDYEIDSHSQNTTVFRPNNFSTEIHWFSDHNFSSDVRPCVLCQGHSYSRE